MTDHAARHAMRDLAVLIVATLLVTAPGLSELGFYSDDWAFIADLVYAPDQSLLGAFRALRPHDGTVRPLQFLLLGLTYHLFGPLPMAFHLLQLGLVLLAASLLYLVLRQLRLPPAFALAVAILWAVLPHHSSARLWVAAMQIPLAAAAYFAHVFAELKAAESAGRVALGWGAVSVTAILGSLFSYEIFLPLMCLTPVLVRWHTDRLARGPGVAAAGEPWVARRVARRLPWIWVRVAGPLLVALVVKATLSDRLGQASVLERLARGARTYYRIVPEHADEFGVRVPATVLRAALDVGVASLVAPALAGLVAALYLRSSRQRPVEPSALRLVLTASVIYVLGYAIAFVTGGVGTALIGPNNRTAMAASLGVALAVTAAAVGLSRGAKRHGSTTFAVAVGAVIAAAGVIDAAVATRWAAASQRQSAVLLDVRTAVGRLEGVRAILVGGVCRYVGPGIVLESSWGVTGALRVLLEAPTLRGDVVSPSTRATSGGVVTELYGKESAYPYAGLTGYDARNGTVVALRDSVEATRFLASVRGPRAPVCPETPRRGGPLFP